MSADENKRPQKPAGAPNEAPASSPAPASGQAPSSQPASNQASGAEGNTQNKFRGKDQRRNSSARYQHHHNPSGSHSNYHQHHSSVGGGPSGAPQHGNPRGNNMRRFGGHSRANSFQQGGEPYFNYGNVPYGFSPYTMQPNSQFVRANAPPRPNPKGEETVRSFREQLERRRNGIPEPEATSNQPPASASTSTSASPAPASATGASTGPSSGTSTGASNSPAPSAPELEKPAVNNAADAMRQAIAERRRIQQAQKEAAEKEAADAKKKADEAEEKAKKEAEEEKAKKEAEEKVKAAEKAAEAAPAPAPAPAAPASAPAPAASEGDEPEVKPVGKWVPPFMRSAAAKAKADADLEAKAKVEAEEKAKSAETEEKAEEKADSVEAEAASTPEAEAKTETKAVETKADSNQPEFNSKEHIEQFTLNLEKARVLTADELKEKKYPDNVNKNELASSTKTDQYKYTPDFLGQFSTKVPRVYYSKLHPIIGYEYQPQNARWGSGFGPRGMSGRGPSRSGSHMGFGPGKGRNGPGGGGSMRGRNASRRKGDRGGTRRGERGEEITSTGIPIADLPPLRTAENAWTPSFMKKKDEEQKEASADSEHPDKLSPEEVQRKVKSLLNKMAWENFESVSNKILAVALQAKYEDDVLTLRQIVELTFDKAIDEPHWAQIYASFFLFLHTQLPDDIVDRTDPDKIVSGVGALRRYMLNRSQQEFEKGWSEATTDHPVEMMSDEYYQQIALKRRGLGLIQFIGEIYKLQIISAKLLGRCFVRLASEDPSEDVVESMCKLIRTTAVALLEADKQQRLANGGQPSAAREGAMLEMAMGAIRNWRENPKFNIMPRLKFKIMDIEDLAKKRFVGADESNGPKTIAQVHLEAKMEQERQEKEKARNSRQGSRRGDFGRSGSGRNRR